MNDMSPGWSRLVLALLAMLAAWALFGLSAPDPQSFDVDEAEYIAMGAASLSQALGETDASLGGQVPGAIEAPWRDGFHKTTFGFQSPGLPKLLFGLIARGSNVRDIDAAVWPRFVSRQLSRSEFKAKRQAAKAKLVAALGPARQATRLLAALVAALLFAIAHRMTSGWQARPWITPLAGATAALFWISSPAVSEAAHHVRPGLLPVTFWCAALLTVLTLRLPKGQLVLTLMLGLSVGLATSGKLNGVLLAPLVPFFLHQAGARRLRLVAATGLAAALSFATFVALSPGLWHDTAGGLAQIVAAWRGDLAHQTSLAPAGSVIPTGRLDALLVALKGLASEGAPLSAVLGFFGLGALAKGAYHSTDDRITLAWCLVLLLGSGLIIPFERLRYLVPLAAPAALAASLLLTRLAAFLIPAPSQAEQA